MEASLADACRLNKMATVDAYERAASSSNNQTANVRPQRKRKPRSPVLVAHSDVDLCQQFAGSSVLGASVLLAMGFLGASYSLAFRFLVPVICWRGLSLVPVIRWHGQPGRDLLAKRWQAGCWQLLASAGPRGCWRLAFGWRFGCWQSVFVPAKRWRIPEILPAKRCKPWNLPAKRCFGVLATAGKCWPPFLAGCWRLAGGGCQRGAVVALATAGNCWPR